MFTHRARGVPVRKGTTTTHQLPSIPKHELTSMSRDDSGVRQHTLIGDSFNDEQWSDDLSNPSSY